MFDFGDTIFRNLEIILTGVNHMVQYSHLKLDDRSMSAKENNK